MNRATRLTVFVTFLVGLVTASFGPGTSLASPVERLIPRAGQLGIDTSKIERVSHERAR